MIAPAPRSPDATAGDGPAVDLARAARDARLATLVQAAAAGDSSAFETFYDDTSALARALARRVLGGADLDELLADAFFEAWRNAARFDVARGSAVSWLLTIVKSRSLDLLRHRAVRPSTVDDGDEALIAEPGDSAAEPAERLWRQQSDCRLHCALQQLSSAERWVLGLAYFRDMSHSEIAGSTGMPLGTVKSHVLRAQTKLRTALAGL